jgi:hypothetical protein
MTPQQANEITAGVEIPDYMKQGIFMYLVHGIPPGSFLMAVLENDLYLATHKADVNNAQCLIGYGLLLERLPENTWGSHSIVQEYLVSFAKEISNA